VLKVEKRGAYSPLLPQLHNRPEGTAQWCLPSTHKAWGSIPSPKGGKIHNCTLSVLILLSIYTSNPGKDSKIKSRT
jgi:hypothetical protein